MVSLACNSMYPSMVSLLQFDEVMWLHGTQTGYYPQIQFYSHGTILIAVLLPHKLCSLLNLVYSLLISPCLMTYCLVFFHNFYKQYTVILQPWYKSVTYLIDCQGPALGSVHSISTCTTVSNLYIHHFSFCTHCCISAV